MKILALEFSSPRRAVALVEFSGGKSASLAEAVEHDFRGSTGMALVERVLREAGIGPAEVERIAVGLGPGSYTGIRSALAMAQGWQLGRGTLVAGISTADLLAAQCAESGMSGRVRIVIDAQRQEVYSAIYDLEGGKTILARDLEIVPSGSIRNEAGLPVIGPEATRFVAGGRDILPDPRILAELGGRREVVAAAEALQPIYLRPASFVKAPPPRQI